MIAVPLPPMHEAQVLGMLIFYTRNEESLCVCIFFTRLIQVIAIYIIELQPLILPQASHATLKELISTVNVFAAKQGDAVVKRQTKKSKKGVLRKAVLMCNRSKAHVDEERLQLHANLIAYLTW